MHLICCKAGMIDRYLKRLQEIARMSKLCRVLSFAWALSLSAQLRVIQTPTFLTEAQLSPLTLGYNVIYL